jgi:hypothetical protein
VIWISTGGVCGAVVVAGLETGRLSAGERNPWDARETCAGVLIGRLNWVGYCCITAALAALTTGCDCPSMQRELRRPATASGRVDEWTLRALRACLPCSVPPPSVISETTRTAQAHAVCHQRLLDTAAAAAVAVGGECPLAFTLHSARRDSGATLARPLPVQPPYGIDRGPPSSHTLAVGQHGKARCGIEACLIRPCHPWLPDPLCENSVGDEELPDAVVCNASPRPGVS